MNPNNRISYMSRAAIIAALYTVITWLCSMAGLSSGVIQLRLSEALIVLTAFTPAAIPGMTVGCLISNLIAPGTVPWDVVFGTLATFLGALGGYFLRRYPALVPLPNIVANTVIVPLVLRYAYGAPDAYWFLSTTVFLGEFITSGIFGLLLYSVLKKYKRHLN